MLPGRGPARGARGTVRPPPRTRDRPPPDEAWRPRSHVRPVQGAAARNLARYSAEISRPQGEAPVRVDPDHHQGPRTE
ncbi:hypothetical protein GFH48_12360 [Streptomyces fagopyri]|uniref:Uncharacterized protein n=1 Tax=Streptomyces fagopyri TaxID=2662397 RepID=A0A5Q0LA91_9ACTN|nr:hypothetical protein GFH48_12360 [Streptomyces fagopyri]